ncbi:hypothetical protein [Glycomyces sp. NRRL B-16210]|uniref:hypothetical protein n=1 Tax=Glycomyces sp. NRRL B-16210 TaxID=1463821 RepID=UPI000AD828F9|nr:hypothetical protein [Glycomyces sp. NRRL B-16210]
MDDFSDGAAEIFDGVVDSVADAIADIEVGEVWEDIADGVTEAWETVSEEAGELFE